MTLKLKRTDYYSDGIFGELRDISGFYVAATLEHAYDAGLGNGSFTPKLPPGSYKCIRGVHKLHDKVPFETFEVTNVPNHSGILFHVGNYNKDSDGCILLGTEYMKSAKVHWVAHSKAAFQRFLDLTKHVNEFTLIVT